MIVMREQAELLALIKDVPSQVRHQKGEQEGEFREPARCPYCDSLMVTSVTHGRPKSECMECDPES